MKAAYANVLGNSGEQALQYGPADGYAPLREWIAEYLFTPDCKILPEQILMVSGSQQALDMLGKVLIDKGSKVLVETPSYLGALQAFSVYCSEFHSVETDGMGWCRPRSKTWPMTRACCTPERLSSRSLPQAPPENRPPRRVKPRGFPRSGRSTRRASPTALSRGSVISRVSSRPRPCKNVSPGKRNRSSKR